MFLKKVYILKSAFRKNGTLSFDYKISYFPSSSGTRSYKVVKKTETEKPENGNEILPRQSRQYVAKLHLA